ncbi:MAG: PorP/SprF family type IX secretion system membrane protein [Saprospiraceae bacterium]|nr:PorP/SprF family type IX secretion system membrane protein [Saprospiraceae bacterium]
MKALQLLLICLVFGLSLNAQDIHFSHIHASPFHLNPALTGIFEGDMRLIANYRNQWRSVTADYKTMMASADMKIGGFNKNSIIGFGAHVNADVAGDLDFTTQSAALSASFMQAFDRQRSHILAGGIQVGRVSARFDPSKMQTYEEETFFDGSDRNRIAYYDMAAGLLWYKRIRKQQFLYFGASVFHLNNPVVSFFDEEDVENILYRRYVVHTGANIALNKWYTLVPNIIFMQQGPHQQLTLGSFVRYNNPSKIKKANVSLMLGGWIRAFALEERLSADAVVGALRIDYQNLVLTFTYDVNISTLAPVSYGQGGPEFSLIYLIGSELSGFKRKKPRDIEKKRKHKIACPVF